MQIIQHFRLFNKGFSVTLLNDIHQAANTINYIDCCIAMILTDLRRRHSVHDLVQYIPSGIYQPTSILIKYQKRQSKNKPYSTSHKY